MAFALVVLGWRPADYWAATPHEYWAAYELWREMNPVPED
jgi:hypothetical protein